jgi:hypothetical protein
VSLAKTFSKTPKNEWKLPSTLNAMEGSSKDIGPFGIFEEELDLVLGFTVDKDNSVERIINFWIKDKWDHPMYACPHLALAHFIWAVVPKVMAETRIHLIVRASANLHAV